MSDLEKWRSIGIVSRRTRWAREADRRLDRDRDAYQRLRRDGHQPPRVDGSARLERDAVIPLEIEMGRTFSAEERPHAEEGERVSYELGLRGPKR